MSEPLRLGGMALRNGLLVHGPTHWAAAIRARSGELRVASGPKPRLRRFDRVPGVRGVARLAEAFAVIPLVKRALPAAQLPFEDVRVAAGVVGASATGVLLRRHARGPAAEAVAGIASLAPALLSLRGGETAAYHGVEHKSIAAYEQGEEDAAGAAKEHDRCGSNLVAPMLAANVAGAALLRRAVQRPGPLANAAVAVGSVAVAVEVFSWAERHGDSRTARALRRPGYELQRRMGTREPTAEQLEVGRAALAEIVRVESRETG
jgi:uncharacterized protein YqhQ